MSDSRWTQEQVTNYLMGASPAQSMSESELQASVCRLATQLGWLWYHTHSSLGSAAGFPDLVLVRDTRLIFAELKTEKAKVEPEQQKWLYALGFTAAERYLWRPSMIDEIVELLRSR